MKDLISKIKIGRIGSIKFNSLLSDINNIKSDQNTSYYYIDDIYMFNIIDGNKIRLNYRILPFCFNKLSYLTMDKLIEQSIKHILGIENIKYIGSFVCGFNENTEKYLAEKYQ